MLQNKRKGLSHLKCQRVRGELKSHCEKQRVTADA